MGVSMKTSIKVTLGTAALAVTSPALAADLPSSAAPMAPAPAVLPAFTFAGFYAGVFGGVHGMERHEQLLVPGDVCAPATFPEGACRTVRHWGGLAGIAAGYNFQSGSFVYGLEADIAAAFGQASSFGVVNINFPNSVGNTKIDWMGTIRARAGFVVGQATLLYLTAGYAMIHQKSRFTLGYVGSTSGIKGGLVVGGGFETAINNNWSVKGEALFIPSTGSQRVLDATGPKHYTVRNKNHVIVKLGLNYRFGGPAGSVMARY